MLDNRNQSCAESKVKAFANQISGSIMELVEVKRASKQ